MDIKGITAMSMPEGEYAIVEALGHRTLIGRVAEVERFGTKMLQVEPLFGSVMLDPVLLGGSSIYQFTPCSAETAYARRPQNLYQLPGSIAATVPPIALPSNDELPSFLANDDGDCRSEANEARVVRLGDDIDDDGMPF